MVRCEGAIRHWFRAIALGLSLVAVAQAAAPDLSESIRSVRMGTLTIHTAPNANVRVEQLRHEFWFGAAVASQMFSGRNDDDAAKYKQVFLENSNSAVTENALKWHSMERRQGTIDYTVVDAILDRTKQQDKQRWTSWEGRADSQGKCEIAAFFGKHRVTSRNKDQIINLGRTERTKIVSFADRS